MKKKGGHEVDRMDGRPYAKKAMESNREMKRIASALSISDKERKIQAESILAMPLWLEIRASIVDEMTDFLCQKAANYEEVRDARMIMRGILLVEETLQEWATQGGDTDESFNPYSAI